VQGYVAERILAARHEQRDVRTLREATDDFHREFVLQALENRRVGRRWNIMATAKDLDVSRNQIYALIERLGLRPIHASKASRVGARD